MDISGYIDQLLISERKGSLNLSGEINTYGAILCDYKGAGEGVVGGDG